MGELSGKVAIVTGAGSGIGRATAIRLGAEGAWVAIAGRTRATCEETAEQVRAAGGKAIVVQTDVTARADVERLIAETCAAFGGVDILVNNAGINLFKSATETDEAEWDQVFDTNVKGAWLCAKYAIPVMRQRGGGSIVNVGSIHSFATAKQRAAYAASKHAILGLTRSLALDYAEDGIRANCVCPGPIDTPLLRSAPGAASVEERLAAWSRLQPIGRVGQPIDVAEAIVYFASPRSAFVTGTFLLVDGGVTAKLF